MFQLARHLRRRNCNQSNWSAYTLPCVAFEIVFLSSAFHLSNNAGHWEAQIISLSAAVVDAAVVGNVTSHPHNHRDWLMQLFAVILWWYLHSVWILKPNWFEEHFWIIHTQKLKHIWCGKASRVQDLLFWGGGRELTFDLNVDVFETFETSYNLLRELDHWNHWGERGASYSQSWSVTKTERYCSLIKFHFFVSY